jgi:hypothetical protein
MSIRQKQVGWNFWLAWTGLTIAGGLVGSRIADLLSLGMLNRPTDEGILFSMLGSAVFALTVCAAQWIVLRRMFSGFSGWLVAGTLGRALGFLLGSFAIVLIGHQFALQAGFWSSTIFFIVRGIVLGASQWLIIKQWRIKAGWWVLGSAVGWMLGPSLLGLIAPSAPPLVSDLISDAIAGAITGAFMVWILRQPAPKQVKDTSASRLIVTWIGVWALSWGVSWAAGWSLERYIIGLGYTLEGGRFGGMLAGEIAGLIGGVGTAIVLKRITPSIGLKIYHLVLIALGWAAIVYYDWLDGFVIAGLQSGQSKYGVVVAALSSTQVKYGIGGPLSGLVGGLLTALILFWAVRSLDWKQLAVIVIGWALGFAVGGWVVWSIGFQIAVNYVNGPTYGNDPGVSSLILFTIISLLGGAFAGWIGAAGTLGQFSNKNV